MSNYPAGTPSIDFSKTSITTESSMSPATVCAGIIDNYSAVNEITMRNSVGYEISLLQNFVNATYLGREATPVKSGYLTNTYSDNVYSDYIELFVGVPQDHNSTTLDAHNIIIRNGFPTGAETLSLDATEIKIVNSQPGTYAELEMTPSHMYTRAFSVSGQIDYTLRSSQSSSAYTTTLDSEGLIFENEDASGVNMRMLIERENGILMDAQNAGSESTYTVTGMAISYLGKTTSYQRSDITTNDVFSIEADDGINITTPDGYQSLLSSGNININSTAAEVNISSETGMNITTDAVLTMTASSMYMNAGTTFLINSAKVYMSQGLPSTAGSIGELYDNGDGIVRIRRV